MQLQDRTAGLGPYKGLNVSANREDFKVLMCYRCFVLCSNYSKGDCSLGSGFQRAILESGDSFWFFYKSERE